MPGSCSNFSSIFLSIINIKVAKITQVFWLFNTLVNIMAFLFASVIFDMAQVFSFILYHFKGIDPSCWISSSTAFLIMFVFLRDLSLGLSLRLTCISKKGIIARLSLIIPIVLTKYILPGGSVALWISEVNLLYS